MAEQKEKTFGEWARRMREKTPHSLRYVAEVVGVKPQTLSNVETSYRKVEGGQPARLDYDKVIKLAEFYGQSPAKALELAGYHVYHPKLSKMAVRVGEVVDYLPEPEQEEVLTYAEMRLTNYRLNKQGGSGSPRKSGITTTDPGSRSTRGNKKDLRRRAS